MNKRGVKLVRSLSGRTPQVEDVAQLVRNLDAEAAIAGGGSADVGVGGAGAEGGLKKRVSSGAVKEEDKDVKDLLVRGVEPLSKGNATHVVLTGKETYLQVIRSREELSIE